MIDKAVNKNENGGSILMNRLIAVVILFALVSGCSYIRPTKRLDLAPFAENTISLATEIDYGVTESSNFVNLRVIWNDPVLAAHRMEWEKIRALLKGVVAYSVELTTLGNSTLDGPERARALADFLEPLARPVLESDRNAIARLGITPAKMDSVLLDIRGQKDLLGALGAAQPIIDEVARVSDDIFDEVDASLDRTTVALVARLDQINRNAVYFQKVVDEDQYSILQRFLYLDEYRNNNDISAADSLFMEDPQLLELVKDPKNLTLDELSKIEDRLLLKMNAIDAFSKQIQPDIDRYHAQQIELAGLYVKASNQLKRARTTMIVWSRAHRNLAQGITDPARIDLFDITKKALKTAL